MLIFIHLILYIFIHSLQSITKNVSGVENSSNNNLNQLEYIYDNYEQTLTIVTLATVDLEIRVETVLSPLVETVQKDYVLLHS
uniref:Uncharacterized protein n=1 Tax=Meloidogyne enterolobii TaxID=390850 RepID=A0A6V7V7I1_MELEN|nr:unnamed protein product [Meloidogyne enterolobii]